MTTINPDDVVNKEIASCYSTIESLRDKLESQQEIIANQRIAIQAMLKVTKTYLNYIGSNQEADKLDDLREIYKQVSSASTMTGTSEE